MNVQSVHRSVLQKRFKFGEANFRNLTFTEWESSAENKSFETMSYFENTINTKNM